MIRNIHFFPSEILNRLFPEGPVQDFFRKYIFLHQNSWHCLFIHFSDHCDIYFNGNEIDQGETRMQDEIESTINQIELNIGKTLTFSLGRWNIL